MKIAKSLEAHLDTMQFRLDFLHYQIGLVLIESLSQGIKSLSWDILRQLEIKMRCRAANKRGLALAFCIIAVAIL
jgi:hypothetical protein